MVPIAEIESQKINNKMMVQPSSDTKTVGFQKELKDQDAPSDWAYKFFNTVSLVSYYALYHKYSEIIYEGNEVVVFGILSWNQFSESWEISKPLAFLNSAKQDLIDIYQSEKIYSAVSIGFTGLLLTASVVGLLYFAKRIYRRNSNRVLNYYR